MMFAIFLLLLINIISGQNKSQNKILITGHIIDATETTITLDNINVLKGSFIKDEITVFLFPMALMFKPITSDWLGKNIIIVIKYDEYHKRFSSFPVNWQVTRKSIQPALTPNGASWYLLTKENNLQNGITDKNEKIINAIQKITKIDNIKDKSEKLKRLSEIVNDPNEYLFIREYCIWELKKLRIEDICLSLKQRDIITSLIDNEKIPLYIRIKARDFYPDYPDYSKYYRLLYDLQNSKVEENENELIDYKNYYKNEVTKKNEEDESIIELINQNIKK